MYGDEESGTPPDELYDCEDALEALEMAKFVYDRIRKLLDEYLRQ